VSAFSYEIIAPAGVGMTFTDTTINGLSHPYIFDGTGQQASFNDPSSPFYDPSAPPFVLSYDSPGTDIFISDVSFLSDFTAIAPGAKFSLGLISFEASPTAPLEALTPLQDPTGGTFPISSPVPEPSSLVLSALAGVLVVGLRCRNDAFNSLLRVH
jgi:hypothetical protein